MAGAVRLGPPTKLKADTSAMSTFLNILFERMNTYSGAADPTAAEIPEGQWVLYRNTTSGTSAFWTNIAGVATKLTVSSSGSPGGSTTQVQFNDAGAFGGDADYTYDKTTNTITLGAAGGTGTITGADNNSAGTKSGNLTVEAGGNAGIGSAGDLLLQGGEAASGANGGTVTLKARTGGTLNIQGGDGPNSTNGGPVNIRGGTASGGGTGGLVTIQGADTDKGGNVIVKGGKGTSGNNATGGNVTITGGEGAQTSFPGNSIPGDITITGGASTGDNNEDGGDITITAGAGSSYGSSTSDGGAVTISGGAANGNNRDGGNVILKGGAPNGTGDRGNVGVDNGGAIATTSTGGFLIIPTCAGTPTGTPANVPTGAIALVYDTTNEKLYVYNTAWKSVTLA